MSQRSEDELGDKMDRCLADTALKTAAGAAIGIISSALVFRRRTWPIWLGIGVGIGAGCSNCRHELNKPFTLHGRKVQTTEGNKPTYQIAVEGQAK